MLGAIRKHSLALAKGGNSKTVNYSSFAIFNLLNMRELKEL
jgi:hypothetical protein